MKASLDLIKKLRMQLPPEAQETLDELEGMAGGEEEMRDDGSDEPADDMEMPLDEESEMPEDDLAPLPEGDEEESDEPADVNAVAAKPKKSKKPSFWS